MNAAVLPLNLAESRTEAFALATRSSLDAQTRDHQSAMRDGYRLVGEGNIRGALKVWRGHVAKCRACPVCRSIRVRRDGAR